MKRILKIVLVLAVVLLTAVVALFFITFESPELKNLLVEKVSQELGHKVEIERLTVNLLRGAELKNVVLYPKEKFGQRPLLQTAELYLRHKLIESLLARRPVINQMIIDRPGLFVIRDEEGILSCRDLLERKGRPSSISRLVIKEAKITLQDKKAGTEIGLDKIDLKITDFSPSKPFKFKFNVGKELKAAGEVNITTGDVQTKVVCRDFPVLIFGPYYKQFLPPQLSIKTLDTDLKVEKEQDRLSSKGNLQIKGVSWQDKLLLVKDEKLSLDYNLSGNLKENKLTVNSLKAIFSEMQIYLSGTIEDFDRIAFNVSWPEIELSRIKKFIQKSVNPELDATDLKGIVSLQVKSKGSLKSLSDLDYDGQAELKTITFQRKDLVEPVNISGQVRFNPREIVVPGLILFTDRLRLSASGRIIEPSSKAILELTVKGDDLALIEVAKFFPKDALSKIGILSGKVDLKTEIAGQLNDLKKAAVTGNIVLNDVRLKPDQLDGILELSGGCHFTEKSLTTQRLSAKFGRSDFTVSGEAKNLQRSPEIRFSLNSKLMNIDELLAVYKKREKRPDVQEKTDLVAIGTLDISELIYLKESYRNVHAEVKFADNELKIPSLTANLYDGSLGGQGRLLLAKIPTYEFTGRITDVTVNQMLSHLTPVKDLVFGRLTADISFSGQGVELDQMKRNLTAVGDIRLNDGRLRGRLPLKEGFLNLLGISKEREIPYQGLSAQIKIKDGVIKTADFKISGRDMDIWASGEVSLDSRLNLLGTSILSKDLSDMVRGEVSSLLKDKEGRLSVSYELTGTLSSPRFRLSTRDITEKIQQESEEKVTKEVDRLKEEVQERLKEEEERLKKEAEKKIKEETKRLLDKLFK
ncbi:TPA: hypothetical protein DCX15_02170 [bacterium]|nr:hypothetical protein [bacterium]